MARVSLQNVSVTFTAKRVKVTQTQSDGAQPDRIAGGLLHRRGRDLDIHAIRDLSISLKPGDRLGISGRNGAGKTTLLRTIAGIYSPQSGQVVVEGSVATMFNIGLGMDMDANGYENIRLAGIVSGKSSKEISARMNDIADFTGLGDYLSLPIRTYSQGMAMRLKFGCATAFDADILLFDEWLGAGDPAFQKRAKERLDEMLERSKIVVLASHNTALMKSVCNKFIVMQEGTIVETS